MRVDLNDAILDCGETPSGKLVLFAIASYMNKGGDTAWPSQETLSTRTGLHRASVVRILKGLADRGIITRKRRFSASTVYGINDHLLHHATSGTMPQMAPCDKSHDATSGVVPQIAPCAIHLSHHAPSFVAPCATIRPMNRPIEPSIDAFAPPTLTEVSQQCARKGYHIDPQEFLDGQEARGWKMGSGVQVKSWKLALATWNKHAKPKRKEPMDEAEYLLDKYSLACKGTRLERLAAMRQAVEAFDATTLREALAELHASGKPPWANELLAALGIGDEDEPEQPTVDPEEIVRDMHKSGMYPEQTAIAIANGTYIP